MESMIEAAAAKIEAVGSAVALYFGEREPGRGDSGLLLPVRIDTPSTWTVTQRAALRSLAEGLAGWLAGAGGVEG